MREDEAPKILVNSVLQLEKNGGDIMPSFAQTDRKSIPSHAAVNAPVQKLYLRVPSQSSEAFRRVCAFLCIFRGKVPVTFYDEEKKTAFRGTDFGGVINDFTLTELREILGDASVVVK